MSDQLREAMRRLTWPEYAAWRETRGIGMFSIPNRDVQHPGFTCPRCGRTSHNPNDVREGYCGACHDWTGAT